MTFLLYWFLYLFKGAFARLQANLEKPSTPASAIYSEKYEAFRIQRSLKEHGVLPSELRSNEQLQKYGLDKSLTEPPKVLPKPSRGTVESKRGAFSKNRADTMPAPSTVIEEPSPQKNDMRYSSLDDSSIVTSKEGFTKQTLNTEDNKEFSAEIKSEVTAMQDVIARKKNEIVKGQRHLNETIEELERIKFELDSNKIAAFVEGDENDNIRNQTISEVIDVQPDNSYEKAPHAPADASAESCKKSILIENELVIEPTDSFELLSSESNKPSTELEDSPAKSVESAEQIDLSKVDDNPSTKTYEIQPETEFVNSVKEPFEVIDEPVKSIDLLNETDNLVSDLIESSGIIKPALQLFESSTEQVKSELLEESVVKPSSPIEFSDRIETVTQSIFSTHQENKSLSNENELEANTTYLPSDSVSEPNYITNLTQDSQELHESFVSEKILQENFSSHNADQELQEGKSHEITSSENNVQQTTGHSTGEESVTVAEIDVIAEKPFVLETQLFSTSSENAVQELTGHSTGEESATVAKIDVIAEKPFVLETLLLSTSSENTAQESTGHSTGEESVTAAEIGVLAEKSNELTEGLSPDHAETNVQLFTESNSFKSYTQEVTEYLDNTEQDTGAKEEHVSLCKNDLEDEIDGAAKIAINIEDVNNNTSAYTFDTAL